MEVGVAQRWRRAHTIEGDGSASEEEGFFDAVIHAVVCSVVKVLHQVLPPMSVMQMR